MLLWTAAMLALARASAGTLPVAHRHPLRPGALWRNYRACSPAQVRAAGPDAHVQFRAFFIYIAAAPAFLVGLLGVSTWGFAWLFVPMITGIMIGAYLSGRLAGRMSPKRTIRTGYVLLAVAVASNLVRQQLRCRRSWRGTCCRS
jgi:DHA1 family bicyclomycin/chloramphenicol resistance-like MFS transporter